MTQIFVDTRAVPVTVIKAGPCVVTQIRTEENDGYDAVQLAYGTMRPRDVSKPDAGALRQGGSPSRRATWSSSAPTTPGPTSPASR
jgi:large subunit ribosomal protein L3